MPSNDFNFHASDVFVVREDEGRPPEFIPLPFDLRVRYQLPALVLFRLAISFTGSVPTKTTVYLQITADRIQSLEKKNYGTADTNIPSPPYLETVRQRLNGMRSVTRLQFRLHSGKGSKLIVPLDFTTDKVPDDPAFEAAESLAVASLFSLYMRHDILEKLKFVRYKAAIRQFPDLTETEKQAYECMVDVSRLYHGAGGNEHTPRDHHGSSPAREPCRSPAPATTASYGSTVPFETVPRHHESLPPYDECLSEGQSPRATLDATGISTGSRSSECAPPEYSDTESRHNVLFASHGAPYSGREGIDIHPATKRKRPLTTTVCKTTTSTIDAPRPEKLLRSLFADSDDLGHVMRILEQQQQQIARLQQSFEESQRQNKMLKRRCDELEGKCFELENRQVENVDNIEILSAEVDDVKARCDTLEKQMPDVCDEMEDWKEKMVDAVKEDMCKSIEDSMAKQIEESVEAQVEHVKRRICKALQPA